MKTHPTQFDVRENTASPRQHDSRLATDVHSNLFRTDQRDLNTRISPSDDKSQTIPSDSQLHAAPQRAATGERDGSQLLTVREVADVASSSVLGLWTNAQTVYGAVARISAWQILAIPRTGSIGVGPVSP
jgi:hypothetical protein